jgi:hypothetical protein
MSFCIADTSIMIHCHCLQTLLYVPLTQALFQEIINDAQK